MEQLLRLPATASAASVDGALPEHRKHAGSRALLTTHSMFPQQPHAARFRLDRAGPATWAAFDVTYTQCLTLT